MEATPGMMNVDQRWSQQGVSGSSYSFHSASELSQLFHLVGKRFDALQLTPGRLKGEMSIAQLGAVTLLKITTTHRILLNGDRGPDCISFCIEASGQAKDHKVFCVPMSAYSVHGFKQGLLESHFELSADFTTYLTITSSRCFNDYLEHFGLESMIGEMEMSNSLQSFPLMHQHMAKEFEFLIQNSFVNTIRPQQAGHRLYGLFVKCLTCQDEEGCFIPMVSTPRQELVRRLIGWGFLHGTADTNLDQICQMLFASKGTLIQSTKEALDIGPMELLKRIRLEKVNGMLRSQERRKTAQLTTVSEVAQYFGFRSRGHFARAYQELFSESPSVTLSKARA